MKYLNQDVPDTYRCGTCGAHGVKLWREYNKVLSAQTLSCASCAAKSQDKDISTMREDGTCQFDGGLQYTDAIGWMVPAVPTEQEDTCWGYLSVPQPGVDWWKQLPNETEG